jgi:hypothetical protein
MALIQIRIASLLAPLCALLPMAFAAPPGWDLSVDLPPEGITPPAIELFSEVPGVRQFRGVMVARPVQAAEAERSSLSPVEAAMRHQAAERELRDFQVLRHFPEVDEYLIQVPEGETENSVAARLMAGGNFQYVEPDWLVFPVACPNDALFNQQWHHSTVGSCTAWNTTTGSSSVVVAVCDTGLRTTHQDVQANRRDGFHVPTMKWESAGGPINDINGHGTNCTGSAAGTGNNGVGISGMGWGLGHRTMRVTDATTGDASLSNLTTAARVACDAGDRVASVSYSGIGSSSINTTGAYMRARGSLLVWAAGNESTDLGGTRDDNVIVVGATDSSDRLASFSNFGGIVDVVAPGVSIRTSASNGDTSYAYVSGTSFACPITAGLCGLIWSKNPNLSPAEVENILRSTCRDLGTAGVDNSFGFGRISSSAAIAATPVWDGRDTTPPPPPIALTSTAGSSSVALAWTAPSVTDVAGYRLYRSTTSGTGYTQVHAGLLTTRSYTDTSVINGTTYYYAVAAEDTSGNLSVLSTEASAVFFVLQPFTKELAGTSPGLRVRYFDGTGLTALPDFAARSPIASGSVSLVSYPSTAGNCVGSGLADNVAAVFDGWVDVPTDGMWTWSLTSDAGSRLLIDGEVAVDHDGIHTYSEKLNTIFTKAGRHAVRLEYFETTGNCGLMLRWIPPTGAPGAGTKVAVPGANLSQGGVVFDLDESGTIDAGDIAALLLQFGTDCLAAGTPCYGGEFGEQGIGQGPCSCPGDFDGNASVDSGDIGVILLQFGT